MEKTYRVDLTIKELLLLDGNVNEEAQKVIEQAKIESEFGFDLPIMNEILRKSIELGTITWTRKSVRSCSYCDKKHTYQTYARSSRYHNKGDYNYDKPLYYGGIEFNQGFVTIDGVGDMCADCCSKYQVIEKLIDYIHEKDLKVQIQKNNYRPGKFLKEDIYVCNECKEEFPESKMGRERAMFGGTYPCYCPHCNSNKTSQLRDKFDFILNPLAFEEIISIKNSVNHCNEGLENDKDKFEFYQSQYDINRFVIEKKYFNRFDILRIDTKKKEYKWKKFKSDSPLEKEWIDILNQAGYQEVEKEAAVQTHRKIIR